MIKVNWDVEELVALIDVYRRSDEKSAEQIEVELLALSKAFVERAERLGIEHDEKYRNLNGMKMMFQNVAYVASNGDHGMSAASSAMRKVYDMSNSSPEVFDCNRQSRQRLDRHGTIVVGSCETFHHYNVQGVK